MVTRARVWKQIAVTFAISVLVTSIAVEYRAAAQGSTTLGPAFQRRVLAAALPESAFDLRFFSTAVKTDANGNVITNVDAPGPRKLVGAEAAGERAGLQRFTKIPITMADSRGGFAGDANGPIYVSLDKPVQVAPPGPAYPEGRLQLDRLGGDNLAPLIVMNGGVRQINPVLAANNIAVIKDTHGRTSQLSAADIEALSMYLKSLQK